MSTPVVCITCLASNTRMVGVRGAQLNELFEKIISDQHDTGTVRLCYICYSQLQKCIRFVDMAQKADLMLKAALPPETMAPLKCTNSFISTPTECMSLPVAGTELAAAAGSLARVKVKVEPVEVTDEGGAHSAGAVKIEEFPTPAEDTLSIKQEPCEEFENPIQNNNITYEKELCTRTYECQTCAKTFESEYKLKRHTATHRDTPGHTATHRDRVKHTHTCVKCDRTFARSDTLKLHTSRCSIKMLKSRSQNYLTCKGGRDLVCPICNKTLADLSSLRKHVSSHTVDKPYICDCCGKSFSHRTYITAHIRTHTKDRPFVCQTCGKAFAQLGHLNTHKQCHSSTKAFKCPICDKSFTLRTSLNKHMRSKVHADFSVPPRSDRPFACDVCGRTFGSVESLRRHLKGHVTGPVPCNECGEFFSTPGNMKRHVKRKHRDHDIVID